MESVWVYQVVEIYDRRERPLGKFRMVRWPDSDPKLACGLCDHVHDNAQDALACSEANAIIDHEFRERWIIPGPAKAS